MWPPRPDRAGSDLFLVWIPGGGSSTGRARNTIRRGFGGDPDQVLAGESAGAMSACTLLTRHRPAGCSTG
ncbi:carboxylesterase family protein [Nocardia sp. CA2R105]|nr:carboxylesterase family protein [Nocardia coffeae]